MAPAKKSSSKPARAGSTPSRSGSARAGARASSVSPSKKKTAPKRPRRKKHSDGFLPPLLAAFIAGLLMAGVCFLGISHILETKQKNQPAARVASQATPAGKQSAPGKATLPRINATDSQPAAQAPPGSSHAQGAINLTENEESAITSALVELQELPYEEALHAPLDERIRQVDYALMQAAWQRKLPASQTRLAAVESRDFGLENYRFQTIDILPGSMGDAYIAAVREGLQTWSGEAALRKTGDNEWCISLDGLDTHQIRLFPDKQAFADSATPGGQVPQSSPALVRPSGQTAKMVIVIDDLGANMSAVNRLLGLNYPVTCAFWPHAGHVTEGARAAHRAGREILIHQPMEPLGYPKVAPGPGVLLTGMSAVQINRQVESAIARVPHAVGLNNHMGSRFTQNKTGVDSVIATLQTHNLFMLDSLTDPRSVFADEGRRLGITTYRRNVFLDVTPTRQAILEELRKAERIALLTGHSIAIGHPLPETLAALQEWQRTRNTSIKIVRLQDL